MSVVYTGITCFTALFGAIYEIFSHDVYSYFMIYAFAFPLMLGVLPCVVLLLVRPHMPAEAAYKAWNSGVATLTTGSVYKGVLDIYGTTNKLVYVYAVVGAVFIIAGMVLFFINEKKLKNTCVTAL